MGTRKFSLEAVKYVLHYYDGPVEGTIEDGNDNYVFLLDGPMYPANDGPRIYRLYKLDKYELISESDLPRRTIA